MTLDLVKRFEAGVPLSSEQHDANLDAIETEVNAKQAQFVVRPEDYDLGSDALNIAAAISAGISTGKPVRMDGAYSLSAALSTFSFTGTERLRVDFNGKITVAADFSTPVFQFHATYPTPVAVTAIAQTTRTFPGGSVATNCTRVTAAGHGCAVGDIIKIVSDDTIVPTPTSTHRMGEFAYVADVSGNDLYVAGYLINTFATTIRMVRVRTAPRFTWEGGGYFAATAAQSSWDTFFMRVRGFYQPRVRIAAQDGYDVVLETSSCVQADIDLTLRNLRNRVSTEGVSGYGLQDMSSYQTRAVIRGADARHAYTSNTPISSTSDEPYLYGQTVGATVTGSFFGSSAAAFDVHTEGTDITFTACQTAAARFGEDSSGGGYGMRGTRTRVIDATDRHSANGAQFYAQTSGDCTDNELINFSYIGTGQPIRINELSVTNLATRPKVRGGYLRTSHATVAGVAAFYCEGAVIEDLLIAPNGSANGCTAIVLGTNAEVIVRRLTIDLSGYTGAQFRAFAPGSGSTGFKLRVEGATVINAAGKFQSWLHGQNAVGEVILSGLTSDAAPTTFYQGVDNLSVFQLSDGWTQIGEWNHASDVANVDFTDIAYDEIRIIARDITKGTTGTLNVRVSVTNGSSFLTTTGDYIEIAADGQGSSLSSVPLHNTNATASRHALATISGLRNSSDKTITALNRGTTAIIDTTGVINAIRLLPSSGGNFTGGSITVLGR